MLCNSIQEVSQKTDPQGRYHNLLHKSEKKSNEMHENVQNDIDGW